MLEVRFLQNSTRNCPPFTNNRPATPCSPTPVVAQVQVAPQAPKGYTPQQLEWLDPAKCLPLGDMGKATHTFLGPDAPGIFLVDPVADQLVQDGATALAGSVPLLMVTYRVQANDGPATTLVDSGTGINVIDREYAAQLGLRGTPVPLVGTKVADNRAGLVIEQEYLVCRHWVSH
ncbi:hypothetical protein C351_02907 [Cryptococcus neoformans c8]|nr:hypothetical protein C351_02907 [Cryptococcus neoformans var. grubii c8]